MTEADQNSESSVVKSDNEPKAPTMETTANHKTNDLKEHHSAAEDMGQASNPKDPDIQAKDLEKDPMIAKDEDPPDKSCCGNICKLHKGTTRPDYKVIGLVFVALFLSSFTLTFLFPFLPDMVKWLGYSEEEKGTYVGLIASAVFAGTACSSYFWGWLSDIHGRKLVLLVTIAGCGIFSLLFGISYNLPMALFFRFMAGLANGAAGTAKTVLYEISDDTNQAIGMSAISLAWGCGLIMGPTVGGYLASPTEKYPSVFSPHGFLHDYPFFLPSLVALIICGIGFFVIFFKFDETLQKKQINLTVQETDDIVSEKPSSSLVNLARSAESLNRGAMAAMSIEDVHCAAESEGYFADKILNREISVEVSENNPATLEIRHEVTEHNNRELSQSSSEKSNGPKCGEILEKASKTDPAEHESERSKLLNEETVRSFFNKGKNSSTSSLDGRAHSPHPSGQKESKDDKIEGKTEDKDIQVVYEVQMSTEKFEKSKKSCLSAFWRSVCNSKLVTQMRVSDVRKSIFLYTVFSFGVIGVEDVFTIFLSTDPRYNGLGFSSNEIGLSMGIVSVPLQIVHLAIFPLMVKKFGIRNSFLIGGIVLVITVQTLAMLHPLHDKPVVLWTLLLLILLPERLAVNCCFSSVSLMINNSCTPENAGTVNGIAMTLTDVARTLAPTVAGGIFAWSISYGTEHLGPPFDHNLVFIFFGIIFFISTIECLFLPERLNKQTKKT